MPHIRSPYGNASTSHNHKRRARWHDYSAPGTYMITMVVGGRKPLLGRLEIRPKPHVELSPLGRAIQDVEIAKIHQFYPMIHLWHHCMMPDHLHAILHIDSPLPKGKHLGHVIAGFKSGATKAARSILGNAEISLFEQGYNDKILLDDGQLDRWKRYLDDNPRRLALKRSHPHLFTTVYGINVAGHEYQIFGNQFLLDIPDKEAIVVHRADNDSDFARKRQAWLACGERGGVLVSAAIAEREKQVMREAMDRGYCLILLRNNGFPEVYKPNGEAFGACAEGLLLQISPWDYRPERRVITREECLFLNGMAERMERGD
ncbi:MAG: hypothetical protein LIO91_00655 [Bacteroidales bacterium]|nr:hypothetical protein [Bacteroidales bacterium]